MSYSSWSLGRGGTAYGTGVGIGGWGGGGGGGGWGGGGGGGAQSDRQKDESTFVSLLPVNGKVSGQQVRSVFQSFGLPQQQLAQIWASVDRDGDGFINMSEFCSAMGFIRQAAQQQSTISLFSGVPAGQGGGSSTLKPTPTQSLDTSQISRSVTFPSLKDQSSQPTHAAQPLPVGGVGRGVSLGAMKEGWGMGELEKKRYVMQFNTHDQMRSGFLSGVDARQILGRSGLEQSVLAKVWDLSDVDKDGRLSMDEFAIAMHLIEKAKKGLTLPPTLPSELTIAPAKVLSQDRPAPSPTITTEISATFEDKRKMNFEAGRLELERRRRAIQEKQEKEEAEKERKRKQEEEQRRQQELEAEKRKQAELERQHRKSLAIQQERERQMQKLAQQREAEQRELERRRKEEWARKRQRELEEVKELEMKNLRSLQSQHSNLENELQQLDQEKMAVKDSVSRQSSTCREVAVALRTMRLSREMKKEELSKLRNELNGLQSKLSTLGAQRHKLQEALQSRDPDSVRYQQERQQYQDGIMGIAAALAGLRSTIKFGTEAFQKQQDLFKNNTAMLTELQSALQKDSLRVSALKPQVEHHRTLWLERQQRMKEEERRRQVAERKAKEESERLAREARMERIRREQEQALKAIKEKSIQEKAEKAKAQAAAELAKIMHPRQPSSSPSPPPQAPPTTAPPVSPTKPKTKPKLSPKPSHETLKEKLSILLEEGPPSSRESSQSQAAPPVSKKEEKQKEKEVKKKVKELQQKKAELEKKKRAPPAKPAPYAGKQKSSPTHPPLLDLVSSWDSSAQKNSFTPAPSTPFNPLLPHRLSSDLSDVAISLDGPQKSPEPQTGQTFASTGQPSPQTGQTILQTGQPTVADKGKTTVTSSQAEAAPVTDPEPLYAVVKKPRTKTHTNLDRSGVQRPVQRSSPNLQDWVVVETGASKTEDEREQTDVQEQLPIEPVSPIQAAPVPVQSAPVPVARRRATSTPEREPSLPQSPVKTSTPAHPSSLTTTSITAEIPPLPSTDVSQAVPTAIPMVQYRALYSYDAVDQSEVSFQEEDTLTAVPGEDPSSGWVKVEVKGQTGWAPETYLEKVWPSDGGGGEEGRGGGDGGVVKVEEEEETQVASPEPKMKAKVLYSWKGSKDNHLPIKKGEVISILQMSEKWWSGEADGRLGWFPKTFVKLLEEGEGEEAKEGGKEGERTDGSGSSTAMTTDNPQPSFLSQAPRPSARPFHHPSTAPETTPTSTSLEYKLYKALYDYYEGLEEGDLPFHAGDIIQVTQTEGQWWSGTVNGRSGTFPSNYVQPHISRECTPSPPSPSPSPSRRNPSPEVAITTHAKPLIGKVTEDFQAQKEAQLNMRVGQYVKVFKQANNGWWYGELQSRGKQRESGWFPASHVSLLQKMEGSLPSSSVGTGPATSTPAAVAAAAVQRARSPLIDILDPPKEPQGLAQNLVLALYSYTAASSDELSFHKGSVITVLSKKGDWWKGELNGVEGLFPSNYVQPLNEQQTTVDATRWAESVNPDILASVSEEERKRQEAIFELLSSERNYVDSLKLVKEVFFDPMLLSGVLTDEEIGKVQVNWNELIQCNNDLLNAFLVRLRTSGSVVKNIGDILLHQVPLLTPHIRWCSCQLTACTLLQSKSSDPQFKEFEQKCAQDPRAGGLPLSSFLLKPMQRITKYPLLTQRILDYTPEDHMDHEDLKGALREAERLCNHVNEAVRSKENTEHLEWLQTHVQFTLDENLVFNSQTNFMGQRKLLHWGKLFKIRGNRDLVGFLFNDFFLLVKPKQFFSRAATPSDLEPFGKNEFQMYRKPYLLGDIKVKKAYAEQYGPSVFLMNYPSEEKDIPLKAESDHARDQWIKKMTQALVEYLQTKKRQERELKQKLAQTMKQSVGRLKVTVVKGEDLKPSDPNGKSDPFCVLRFSHQEERTPVVNGCLNPKWNYSVTFAVHDLNEDVLEVTVFDKDLFSPNDFLGCGRVAIKDLMQTGDCPWHKQLLLEDVDRGELELKFELELNESDLLL